MPRLITAWNPVLPTTAAIAPNAPIGASHRIMPRMRKTSAWKLRMPSTMRAPRSPMPCSAKPTSRAMNSACRMLPPVNAEKNVVGMMPRMNSCVVVASGAASYVAPAMFSPSPGWMMLPTTRPMTSANDDMTRK
ncbi:hypothetical protein SRABI128_03036 [Microbacterium sp. Bi128]|nr:hypothetical protein SRABI128_03036 [Microbacterium sp. Bi128]